MIAKEFKDLMVWQKAKNLVLDIYLITDQFPKNELYALTNQFRRAAISIIANIAEGFTRTTIKEKIKFYNIALGSIQECRCFSILSTELKYADMEKQEDQFRQLALMLNKYISRIKENHSLDK
jgi:four helix bundle protein